ncbi:hypothetical protein AGABI2DRAFT_181450 [Agaricus bisporus var. bisporus H97]|uniref:hypothetical protein n=1 Tax=Agaricus bisporus var. bisporus (strain H97 / ATCC MYA-4626 / FGSC 10389) TaxID=936046 RepID=UPI00029F7132|nr:hypothetical protein AGABI2DRAFT_181450 [Agaricus bisporus var. bisporus H97]EKV42239.1 hypothetical protein AGABI2DRAFT_181450 [Agaricus bisporus var. bisporus H97]
MDPTKPQCSRWIPLEGNPEVFNSWAQMAGLDTSKYQFVDIYGLDDNLLSIIPKPTQAVIVLFPLKEGIKNKQMEQIDTITARGQHPIDPASLFVKQKVGNACGTMALIHAIANSDVTYTPDSVLQKFISSCKDKTPEERGDFLETTDLFTQIHLNSSILGQTPQPTNDEDGMQTDLHFSCFVAAPDIYAKGGQEHVAVGASNSTSITSSAPEPMSVMEHTSPFVRSFLTDPEPKEGQLEGMRLIELDGRRPFPIDHGPCVDVLDDAIDAIKKHYLSQVESVYFSLMAFGAAPPDNSSFYMRHV